MEKHILLILIALLLSACSNEEEGLDGAFPEGKEPITFSTENLIMPVSKSLADGEEVGVSLSDNSASLSDNNIAYHYNAGTAQLTAPAADVRYWTGPGQEITVSAYYPYNASLDDISDQHTMDDYKKYDILYAKETIPYAGKDNTPLVFGHLMSRVIVKLTGDADGVTSVEIAETITSGSVDFTQDDRDKIISLEGDSKQITMYYNAPEDQYEALVIPQTIAGGTELIYVEAGGKAYSSTLSSDITFEAGQQYTFTFELN